jgi:hypothetical protein
MRHTARDPKTGRFISTRRNIKVWMGEGARKEFHRIFAEELDRWITKVEKRKCDTTREIPKQAGLLRQDFIGKSKKEITSVLRNILSPIYKRKKG